MSYLTAARCSALNSLSIVATASRSSGHAPLGVIFDATGTTSGLTSRPFHDLLYIWDFGDPSSGTFGYGRVAGLSKNVAYGAMAGHVYDAAGTYTPKLTVFDGLSQKVYTFPSITVTSEDSAFLTTNTICVSTSGTFTGAPSGAATFTYSDFDADIIPLLVSGKRVLLRSGETFNASAGGLLATKIADGLLGKFGGTTRPIVSATGTFNIIGFNNALHTGIVIRDIEFTGDITATAIAFGDATPANRVTLLNLNCHDLSNGVLTTTSVPGNCVSTELFIQDCILASMNIRGGGGGYGAFLFADTFAILGSALINTALGEHSLRPDWARKGVISASNFGPQGASKSGITLRSVYAGDPAVNRSRYIIISDNAVNNGDYQGIGATPSNSATTDERVHDVVIERNMHTNVYSGVTTIHYTGVNADDVTCRNNIAISLATAGGAQSIVYATRGIEVGDGTGGAHTRINSYNNSAYFTEAHVCRGTWFDTGTDTCSATNNLTYAPNATVYNSVLNSGTNNIIGVNTTDIQVKSNDPYASKTTFYPQGYALTSGDITVKVFDDFNSARRGYGNKAPVMDLGAVKA